MGLTRIRAEQISDIDYKQAVRVITTTGVVLDGGAPSTVDGITLVVNDRVLVTGQADGSQNGLYRVQTLGTGENGTWTRTADSNATGEIEAGMIVMVTEGVIYKDTSWKLTTNDPIVVGVTALTFEQNTGVAFGNIYANGTAILSNTASGTVTLAAGENVTITGNNTTKTITIASTGGGGGNGTAIVNGDSNVSINSANANVTITVAGGDANSSVFSPGSLFTGITAVPKTLTGNVVMAANCFGTIINGTVITGNLQIPDGTTVYTWTPS
jgi:hypothetical protein